MIVAFTYSSIHTTLGDLLLSTIVTPELVVSQPTQTNQIISKSNHCSEVLCILLGYHDTSSPMQELLHLWANVASPAADFNAQGNHCKHPRHFQEGLADVECDVCGSQSNGDFNQGIIEDMGQPQHSQFAHDPAKEWATKGHSNKVDENVQPWTHAHTHTHTERQTVGGRLMRCMSLIPTCKVTM